MPLKTGNKVTLYNLKKSTTSLIVISILLSASSCSNKKTKKVTPTPFFSFTIKHLERKPKKKDLDQFVDLDAELNMDEDLDEETENIDLVDNKKLDDEIVKVTSKAKKNKIFYAISQGSRETVKRHLERVDINFIDEVSGDSLLTYALKVKRFDQASLLLSRGINVSHENKRGETALSIAEAINHIKMIALIKERLQ